MNSLVVLIVIIFIVTLKDGGSGVPTTEIGLGGSGSDNVIVHVQNEVNAVAEDELTHFVEKPGLSAEFVWDYFLKKYTPSKQFLTDSNVQQIIRNGQKCDFSIEEERKWDPIIKDCDLTIGRGNLYTVGNLSSVCHKILYLIDNTQCCEGDGRLGGHEIQLKVENAANPSEQRKKPTTGEVWGYGFLFVTLISMCSVVGVSVMPFMGKKLYKQILTVMIGLAVGSLTGSSVFHLIPQAYDLSQNDPGHTYLFTSLVVCGGIWMFFMVERFLKIIMDYKERKDQNWKREKMSSIFSSTPENSTISMLVNGTQDKGVSTESGDIYNTSISSQREADIVYESQEQAIKASFGHQEKPRCSNGHEHLVKFEQGKDSVIATVAWMIIFGDGLHNFIDGLSIGAAFNESILTGISISVAVLCEELPHELGDFAVLLNAGMSIKQALLYNFLSACTCYLGMAIGIFLGKVEASQYIFGVAGGMFLYIALVDMVPEMNEVAESSSKVSVGKALIVLLLQNIGLFIGATSLFILARYQDNMQF